MLGLHVLVVIDVESNNPDWSRYGVEQWKIGTYDVDGMVRIVEDRYV